MMMRGEDEDDEVSLLGAEWLGRLRLMYGQAHRRYHTEAHVRAMLSLISAHESELRDPRALRLAAWFHDAVYDPRRGDNEEQSCALFEQFVVSQKGSVTAAVAPETVRLASAAILATKTHKHAPSQPQDVAFLLAADVAVLAAAPDQYAAYAQAIREEYAHVSDQDYREGRAHVLRQLLAQERLFPDGSLFSSAFAGFEERARANMEAELQRLQSR